MLIIAQCDGEDVGELWSAYQWVRRLAARHDVTLLTCYKRGRTPASRQLAGVRVIEWAEPPGLRRAERFNSMVKPAYIPFYLHCRRWLRRFLAEGGQFDVAYQPVPLAMRYPSPAVGMGIPFVIGPVGGSLPSPPGFDAEEGAAPWYVGLRRLDALRMRRDPLLRRTYEQASCVIGIAPYVRDILAGVTLQRFEVISDAGIERLPDSVTRTAVHDDIRLLFVGRLIRTKGVRDAIRALGLIRDLPTVLDIVGDGADRTTCESLTTELGLTSRVRFHGRLPREQVDAFYRSADVFVFPSYREPGGHVVFEAMAHGLPLVVSDIGGPGTAVDDSSGIRVHPRSPTQYPHDLAAALRQLVSDPERRQALGDGARRRVGDIALWDSKVERLEGICTDILGREAPRPGEPADGTPEARGNLA
jgi:glycosyltransferase involved in cell wall biosynthesis